jgi:outer membrane protein insertion porin family
MRVSPALLACFSLVAIAALPSQAAETALLSDDGLSALESGLSATPEATIAAPIAETTPEASLEPVSQRLEPLVEQQLEPSISPSATLEQLLQGASQQSVEIAQLTDEGSAPAGEPPALPQPRSTGEPPTEPQIEIPVNSAPDSETVEPEADSEADSETETEADSQANPESDPEAGDTENSAPPTRSAPNNAIPVPGTRAPGAAPGTTPGAAPGATPGNEAAAETRVLVSEVDVVTSDPAKPLTDELVDVVYRSLSTTPGQTATRSQLQEDINSIFSTGFFSNVRAEPQDTPLGVKVTFFVEPNPVLTRVDVRNREVLTDEVIDEIFGDQYGKILNLRDFQNSVLDLNDWYQENGYVLAQVSAAPQLGEDGTVTLIAAEGEIETIEVRYINAEGQTVDEEGNPIDGKTREYIVTREFELQPGDVFQESAIQEDIGRVFGLGIFEDIRLSLDPGDEDPRKVKVIVNIAERDTGSIGASLGFNLRGDLFGQLSYNEDNFGGRNQKLRTEGRVTTNGDFLFDVGFTDPWIAGDPYRTSYTTNLFNRRATSLIFDNGPIEVDLPNGDTPRVNRLGTGISFSRPLNDGLSLSLGAQYERVALLDANGTVTPRDAAGNLLTASESGRDDLFTVQFGAVLDRRNNPTLPTSGNLFRLGTEQALPVGNGSIFYNKITGSYSQYVPVNFFNSERGRETIALNLQGGTILGDLPPYEAFPLGGGNSIRGYEEGAVGAGRSFVLGTVEYRFPLFSQFLSGALFADYGTDLGSGDAVPGNPGGVRGKPGSGFGYGAGVRVQTPLGALRLDYGLSDEGSRFHFGFGERF